MTVFDIIEEKGYTRKLSVEGMKNTPWLLETGEDLKLGDQIFEQIILSERGIMPLKSPASDLFGKSYDPLLQNIPEWSIITPRLVPASKRLEKSMQYEINLFLDRMDEVDLPDAFGVTYDPKYAPDNYLDEILSYNPSIIALRYPFLENTSPRRYVNDLLEIRKLIPPNIALYMPGGVGIGFQTLVIALGIDIVDDMAAYRMAANNLIFEDQMIEYNPDTTLKQRIENNRNVLFSDFEKITRHIDRNTLWTRLAREMHTHPSVASSVNLLNHTYQNDIQEEKFTKFTDNKLQFTGEEGLHHPDVIGYRKRVLERYRVRDETKILVLLPCSAKKPYKESRSHKRYEKALREGAGGERQFVTVWSLTSPLGVVPREIETVYPAAHYDIPVTGFWSNQEIQITGTLLGNMLSKVPADVKILAHVSNDYEEMIDYASEYREIEKNWVADKSRGNEALDKLSNKINEVISKIDNPRVDGKRSYREARDTIQAITKYNHGLNAQLNFDSNRVRVVGYPPRPLAIQKDKQHWITWDSIDGEVRLSQRAVQEIALDTHNWIKVGTNKLRGSTLFGIGVLEASEKISPGDEVVFFNPEKDLLLGVGVAIISGLSMNRVNSGPVANIRKKLQIPVDEIQK